MPETQGPEARAHVSSHRHAQRLSLSGAHDGALLSRAHPDLQGDGRGHCEAGIVMAMGDLMGFYRI